MVKKKKYYSIVDKTADSLSPSQVCDILWTQPACLLSVFNRFMDW